jgi:hypothetical protein
MPNYALEIQVQTMHALAAVQCSGDDAEIER